MKKFWEKINYVMPTKEKQAKINLLDQETLEPVNDRNLSYYITNIFAGIGPKLAQQFTKCWVDDLDIDPPNIMSPLSINEETLVKIINEIDIHKSSSIEHISSRVLKDAFTVLIPQLLYMYNQCFRLNIFPDTWKIANIIPLQKPGNPTDVNNLRPISLLPLPGKIMSVLYILKCQNFWNTINYLYQNKGAFEKVNLLSIQ